MMRAAVALILLLVAAAPASAQTEDELRARFEEVLEVARTRHVDAPDRAKLVRGAIEGVLKALDAYCVYLDPEEMARFKRRIEGKYSGIGIEIAEKDGRIVVVTPLEGSPAEAAGLLAGDMLLAIDGKSTRGMTLKDTSDRLLGEAGTKVSVRVRTKRRPPRTVTITRAKIVVQPVSSTVFTEPDGRRIVHVRLRTFQEDTAASLTRALEAAGKVQGVILDLRKNPGGLLESAVDVVSHFVADGVVVTTEGQGGRVLARLDVRGTPAGVAWARDRTVPLAIVVDRASASASEIVAGALQDHGRAVLVGRRTFGKGSVQSVVRLKSGDAVKLTTARYRLPAGRIIDGKGLEPDLKAPPAAKKGGDVALSLARDVVRSWARLRPPRVDN